MAQLLRKNPSWRFWLAATAALYSLVGVGAAAGGAPRHPDLIVSGLSRPPVSAHPAARFTISIATKNGGAARARRSWTRLYLSRNDTKGRGDLLLGAAQAVPKLKPGRTARTSLRETVPRGISLGRWWLVACADDTKRNKESRERHNCRAASRRLLVTKVQPPPAQFSGTFDCYGSTPNCTASPATCTSTISSGLQTALNNAVGGNVICLNSGSYGAVSLGSKPYSSDVIVQPVAGATATIGSIALSSVSHLRFSGVGGTMNAARTTVSGSSSFVTLDHIVYTACVRVDGTASSSHILIDHDRLDNLSGNGYQAGCPDEGRIQVEDGNSTGMTPGWLVISNSHFGGQGSVDCSDGVQVGGDGVTVGPGNEFTGIYQGGCTTHADPVQCVGSNNLTLTGNWFHDNGDGSGGIMCHDFNPANETITNNVFASTGYYSSVLGGGGSGWLISHNVFYKAVTLNDPANGSGNVVRDNVFLTGAGGATDSGSGVSYDHNLNSGKSGTGNLNGTPVFFASPSSGYYHYPLASSSPGYLAASDGKSMGITP